MDKTAAGHSLTCCCEMWVVFGDEQYLEYDIDKVEMETWRN